MNLEYWKNRKQVAKKRLSICIQCPSYVASTTMCRECGCIMLAKAMIDSSECPLSKWSKVEEAK